VSFGRANETSRPAIRFVSTADGNYIFVCKRKDSMSECLHCDIHDLLDSHLQTEEVNLADIAAKVTEVLADLILLAPPEERGALIAEVLANLGEFVLQKSEAATEQSSPRRH
jgi:hypothetical protein